MYEEKINPILDDIENKQIDIAGGSVVGMVIGITSSLITYTCNLTKDKKNYLDVKDEVIEIVKKAQELKSEAIKAIDTDKQIVEDMLEAYKIRKEEPEKYEEILKKSALFCLYVTQKALETLKLANQISKIGNKMLTSDFNICKIYSYASIKASIENVKINVNSMKEGKDKSKIIMEYEQILKDAKRFL